MSLCCFYIDFVIKTQLQPALDRIEAIDKSDAETSITAAAAAKQAAAAARQEVNKAFDFALGQVGTAINANTLWRKYLDFLKSAPAGTLYEQQARRESLRAAYQRAAGVAMHSMDELWVEYTEFEKAEATQAQEWQTIVKAHQTTYTTALEAFKEKQAVWSKITLDLLARPPQYRESRSAEAARTKQARIDEQVGRPLCRCAVGVRVPP